MKKDEIIKYFKRHPEDLYEFCKEFKLHVDFYSKNDVMKHYEYLKHMEDKVMELYANKPTSDLGNRCQEIRKTIIEFEKLYHIFEPEFNMDEEFRWIPSDYCTDAHKVFEYRKEMFDTQDIYQDMLLDQIIKGDIGQIWDEHEGDEIKVGQDFPITVTYQSIVDGYDHENKSYDPASEYNNMKITHHQIEMIRSYCLNSSGGIAIIETITHVSYDDKPESYATHKFQILTLGEDDTYHFLNSSRIYEEIYDNDKDGFITMLNMAINEYQKNK